MVPVGLPFFVDATIADEYLASDRPIIRLRAYGTSLKSGDRVSFDVAGPSLGLAPTVVNGTAFRDVSIPLPPLSVGVHRITIGASATTPGAAALADRLVRTITVVRSRTAHTRTAFDTVTTGLSVPGGPGHHDLHVQRCRTRPVRRGPDGAGDVRRPADRPGGRRGDSTRSSDRRLRVRPRDAPAGRVRSGHVRGRPADERRGRGHRGRPAAAPVRWPGCPADGPGRPGRRRSIRPIQRARSAHRRARPAVDDARHADRGPGGPGRTR